MIQLHNNAMDGVAGLTQQPLKPGATEIYTFTADSQGSYWYHSHFKAQYVDGLKVKSVSVISVEVCNCRLAA